MSANALPESMIRRYVELALSDNKEELVLELDALLANATSVSDTDSLKTVAQVLCKVVQEASGLVLLQTEELNTTETVITDLITHEVT